MQSKRALLAWINNTLHLEIKTIEELGKGFVYAQLLSTHDPSFPSKSIHKNPRSETEYLINLKLCQDYFTKHNIRVFFPIDKMCKCKVQDNLEFLQWLYKFINKKDETMNVSRLSSSVSSGTFVNTREADKASYKLTPEAKLGNNKMESKDLETSFISLTLKEENQDKENNTQSNNANEDVSKDEILDMYSNNCKLCRQNNEIINKYKTKEFYMDSKIKYYEDKILEYNKKHNEFKIMQNDLYVKENNLMKQAVLNMEDEKHKKDIEDKMEKMQIDINTSKAEIEKYFELNATLELQNKEYQAQIKEMEIKEEKNREEFAAEIEKLKSYYCNIINMKEKEFHESKVDYIQYIKNYEIERDMYYMKLKDLEAFLKVCNLSDDYKKSIFEILYKKY